MATNTPNYNLGKPDATDQYSLFRQLFNDNMDIIDENLGGGGSGSANQNIAEDYDDTLTYSVGDYVIYNGLLYKCDTAVTTAETFDPTKWTHVVVTDEMGSGGSGGHTIYDENGTALAQENGLQFTGAVSVSDDSVNGRTVVDIEGGGDYFLNTLYSTDEKKIGYWTDGKPLYQKTFVFNATLILNTNAWKNSEIALADYNFETLVGILGHGANGTIVNFLSGAIDTGSYLCILSSRPSDQYLIGCTLQYTKTTDTADPNPQIGNVIYLPTIYSLEERQVGVWTDGKPLYQKTFTQQLSGKTGNIDISALNAETAFIVGGYYDIGVTNIGLNEWLTNSNLSYTHVNNELSPPYIDCYCTWSNSTVTVTLQYTKTTDVAGSGDWTPSGASAVHYSTEEQVVGTWIDGSTLYKRSIILSSLGNVQSYVYSLASLGVSMVTKVEALVKLGSDGANQWITSPYVENSSYRCDCHWQSSDNSIYIKSNWGMTDAYVTIQYTKTS